MKESGWAKWSSITELLSSIAVLVTLIFLMIETRQNNELITQNTLAMQSNGRLSMLDTELDYLYSLMNYPQLAGETIPELIPGISQEDAVRRYIRAGILIRMRETSWQQYQSGVIDQITWNSYMTVFIDQIESDIYVNLVWERIQGLMDPRFVQAVNQVKN